MRPTSAWLVALFLAGGVLSCIPAKAQGAQLSQAPEPPSIPGPSPDGLEKARALVAQNKLTQAEAGVRGYIAENETSADARFLLGFILFREGKPTPSLAEYTHASHLQRPTAQQLKYVAFDYVLANDYSDADNWMTVVTDWTPQDADAWYSLGRIKYSENRFAESIDCFQKSLALTPRVVKVEDNLGLALEGLNRPEEAIAAYRTAIAWQTDKEGPSEQPLLNLGSLFVDHNRNSEAGPLLEQAVNIAPKDPKIRVALGRLYLRENRLADAQTQLERAVALTPKTAAYHFQLGQIYRKEGAIAKAKSELAEAAVLDSSHSSQ